MFSNCYLNCKASILTFLLLGTVFVSQAQQDSVQLILKRLGADDILAPQNPSDMEVVTASRSGQSIANLPVTVHVITKQEIRLNGYNSLGDVLKTVPGMKVSKPGSALEGETFIMRGLLGNQYAKILINGVPIQPSVKGSIGIGEQLPIAQAERIEIIYGPASSVYGLDAMAGVINIITQTTGSGTLAEANIVVGQDNYRHINFAVGGKAGKNKNVFQYMIYGTTSQREDLNFNRDPFLFNTTRYQVEDLVVGNPFFEPPNNVRDTVGRFSDEQVVGFYRSNGAVGYDGTATTPVIRETPQQSYALGLKLNYRNFQFTFDEMYRRDHASIGREPLLFSYSNPGNFIGENIRRTTLTYQNNWDKFDFTTNLSYLRYRMDNLSSFGANYLTGFGRDAFKYEASDDIFAETLLNYTPNERWNLLFGLAFQRSGGLPITNDLAEPFERSDYKAFSTDPLPEHPVYGDFGFNPRSYNNTSFFMQAFHQKGRFSFIAGLRGEYSTNYDTEKLREAFSSITLPFPLLTRFGLVYKTGQKGALRLSLATGFRAPTPNLEYASIALPSIDSDSINYQQVPNETLLPEISNSIEIGYRHAFSEKVHLDVSIFVTTVDNSIDAEFVELDRSVYPLASGTDSVNGQFIPLARTYINDDSTERDLTGLQIVLRAKDILPVWKTSFDAYLTFSAGSERFPDYSAADATLVGGQIDRLRGTPSFIGQFNLSVQPHKNWYLRFESTMMSDWVRRGVTNATQVDGEFSDLFDPVTAGYFNLDMLARYQISKNLQAYTRITNVFNTDYGGIGATGLDVDLFYNPQLLRNIQFGITFTR